MLHGKGVKKMHESLPPEILPQSLGGFLLEKDAEDELLMQKLLMKDCHYKGMIYIFLSSAL